MQYFRAAIGILAIGLFGNPALAQGEACEHSFDPTLLAEPETLWTELAAIPNERGQYETTEAFQARQTAALPGAWPGGEVVRFVRMSPLRNWLQYEPDQQTLYIPGRAIGEWLSVSQADLNIAFGQDSEFYNEPSTLTLITSTTSEDGHYIAQNAYGAQREVRRRLRREFVLLERPARFGETLYERRPGRGGPNRFAISIPPSEAEAIVEGLTVAVLFAPRAPYWGERNDVTEPTYRRPIETKTETKIMVGDIRCVFILNAEDEPIASRATR